MTRITGLEAGNVVATGLVNMRRFEPRPSESLIVAELLDRKLTITASGDQVSLVDVGIGQTRQLDWVITKLFVRKGG